MSQKIKILHIIPNLNPGGAERVCYELIRNLDATKFSKAVLLFKDSNLKDKSNPWINDLKVQGITVFRQSKNHFIDPLNFWKIIKNIHKYQPDIIHTHLGGDIYGRLAAKLTGTPIIISTEHNLNYSENFGAHLLKKLTAKYAHKICAVSKAVARDAKKRYKLSDNQLTVIYNGLDLDKFKNDSKIKKSKLLTIGALGRLVPQKGFDILLEAISQTSQKNYLVKIGGEGIEHNILQKKINDLKIENQVTLLGQVEPISFLQSIDIFVISSRWEGLGLVALEAGALKKPTIASKIDGLQEIITSKTGWPFSPASSIDLAQKIDYLLINFKQPEIAEKVAANYQNIQANFSVAKMTETYQNLYLSLCNNRKSSEIL